MIVITQVGVTAAQNTVPALRSEFNATGIATLPGFLSPPVLNGLLNNLESVTGEKREEVSGSGRIFGTSMSVPQNNPILATLYFILNRTPLFRLVQEISGCDRPGNYVGRIHRTSGGTDHHIDWHNDVYDHRILGLNINLSRRVFTGGVFELKNPSGEVTAEVQAWSPGDAFLFQISSNWQHRLTPVMSGERTVGVGWFRTRPDWQSESLTGLKSGVLNLLAEQRS